MGPPAHAPHTEPELPELSSGFSTHTTPHVYTHSTQPHAHSIQPHLRTHTRDPLSTAQAQRTSVQVRRSPGSRDLGTGSSWSGDSVSPGGEQPLLLAQLKRSLPSQGDVLPCHSVSTMSFRATSTHHHSSLPFCGPTPTLGTGTRAP